MSDPVCDSSMTVYTERVGSDQPLGERSDKERHCQPFNENTQFIARLAEISGADMRENSGFGNLQIPVIVTDNIKNERTGVYLKMISVNSFPLKVMLFVVVDRVRFKRIVILIETIKMSQVEIILK